MVLLRRALLLALLTLSFPAAASATITIDYAPVPATVGVPYVNLPIIAGGSVAGGRFVVQGAPLPSWLTLDPTTGRLSGTPDTPGQINSFITVTGLNEIVQGVNLFMPVDAQGTGIGGPAPTPDDCGGVGVNPDGTLTPFPKLDECDAEKIGKKPVATATRSGKKLNIVINGVPKGWALRVRGAAKKSGLKKASSGTSVAYVKATSASLPQGKGLFKAAKSIKYVRASWSKKGEKTILGAISAVK
jgi:hypothetical protein